MTVAIKERTKSLRALKLSFPIQLSEDSASVPDIIHVLPTGTWEHPVYGPMVITPHDIAQFKQNFDAGLRKGVRITAGHECYGGPEFPAVGWFTELIDKGVDGLWAKVEWTKEGITLLTQKAFKFFSPEFYEIYEDPQSRDITENVLVGGALTNSPYFKELKAIVFSEPKITNQFNEKTMTIQELMDKKAADLTAEETTFMKEQSIELAKSEKDEDKELAGKIDAFLTPEGEKPKEETEKTEEEKKAEAEAKTASEKNKGMVQISASELSALREAADKGVQAFAELEKKDLEDTVNKLMFSESNKAGKLLPKSKEMVFKFMESLKKDQRKVFTEIIASIETKLIFGEVGDGGGRAAVGKSASDTSLTEQAKALMSEKKAAGINLKFSDALREVSRKNADLTKDRDSNLEKSN